MRIQFASKLLSAAYSATVVTSNRDPRPIGMPRVPDEALEYLLYLLRETEFEGSLLDNPYLSSVGLEGAILEERLRGLPGLAFRRQGDLIDFGWRHHDLRPGRRPTSAVASGAWPELPYDLPLFQQTPCRRRSPRCAGTSSTRTARTSARCATTGSPSCSTSRPMSSSSAARCSA